MSGSSRCLLVILLTSFNGEPCGTWADDYTAVRWLSGQHYAQTRLLPHQSSQSYHPPSTLSLTHARSRPLFSWDLPAESRSTNEEILQKTETGSSNNNIKYEVNTPKRNIWWPWKNYKEWSRRKKPNSRLQSDQNKIKETNDELNIRKVKNRKRNCKKMNGRKNLNKKHKNKKKILVKLEKFEEEGDAGIDHKHIYSKNNLKTSVKYVNKAAALDKKECTILKVECLKIYFGGNYNNVRKEIHPLSNIMKQYESKPLNNPTPVLTHGLRTDREKAFSFLRKIEYKIDNVSCTDGEGGCEGQCMGSYKCRCPTGFRLDSAGKKCLDINECIARNGHGPCQGQCTNTRGSYSCSCANITGTRLASDGHSCEDIDECNSVTNRLDCSHGCINTVGSAFCYCPEGYELSSDWRTCKDIDECDLVEMQNVKCAYGCVNTEGSYKCL